MFKPPRSLTRLLGRGVEPSPPPPEASQWLRRKVLADVHDGRRPSRASSRTRAVHVGVGALLGGAVVLALMLALDGGSSTRRAVDPASAHQGRATLRRAGSRAELVISDMPQPPIGEVYELWLVRPRRAPEATDELFTVTSAGSGMVEIPGGLRGVSAVIVTSEPLGGSTHPTSLPVLRVLSPPA